MINEKQLKKEIWIVNLGERDRVRMRKVFVVLIFSLFLFIAKVNALYKAPVDVTTMSIDELLEAMEDGYLTSEGLVSIYLDRINEYDELFNSINQINEHALEQARELDKEREEGNIKGKLHGIPILVKCNIDVYGMPTTAGTKSLSDNYPKENATVVQKLIDEGAIILGSTNMSELAFSSSNSYSSYGYVRNVFNTDYTAYGSSGGSAVAVAAAFAAASLGTDTNSSIRLPASGAGLVGIRPTLGLVSRSGVIPYDIERDTVGVLSRNVKDNLLLLSIISGSDEKDEYTEGIENIELNINDASLDGVNIGVLTQYTKGSSSSKGVTGETDADIYALIEKSIEELEEKGANIIYIDDFVKSSNLSIATSTYAGITLCDNFDEYLKGTDGTIRSFKQLAKSSGHVQSLSGYVDGCNGGYKSKTTRDKKKAVYRDYVDEVFEEYDLDVVLYPSLKNKVFKYNETGTISPGSSFGSVIGYPSITVPMGQASDGFYYGIEFLAQALNENKLYNVAFMFEEINDNELVLSSLIPSLYEVPDVVTKLVNAYKDVLNKNDGNSALQEWEDKAKEYFSEYNEMEDVSSSAKQLLEEYYILIDGSIGEVNSFNIFFWILNVMITIAMMVIIKNLIKCFK